MKSVSEENMGWAGEWRRGGDAFGLEIKLNNEHSRCVTRSGKLNETFPNRRIERYQLNYKL